MYYKAFIQPHTILGLSRKYGETCFWMTSNGAWSTVKGHCESAAGALAKVDNAEEMQVMLNMLAG